MVVHEPPHVFLVSRVSLVQLAHDTCEHFLDSSSYLGAKGLSDPKHQPAELLKLVCLVELEHFESVRRCIHFDILNQILNVLDVLNPWDPTHPLLRPFLALLEALSF